MIDNLGRCRIDEQEVDGVLAKNKSGWIVLEYLKIKEEEIQNYYNVTGAFALMNERALSN